MVGIKDNHFKLMEDGMNITNNLMEDYMQKRNGCKFYEGCSAPLCPMLSDEDNKNYIWYPDEEICRKVKNIPNWIRQQRKVAKKAKSETYGYYFTLDMLKVKFRVTITVKGLDPDKEEPTQLKQWFKRNKGTKKRKISDKQREKKIIVLAKAKERKNQQQINASLESEAVGLSETPHAYHKMGSETLTLINESEV